MATRVIIPGQEPLTLPNGLSVEAVRNMLGSEISGLSTMTATTRTEGSDTVIEFAQRSGTKGALLAA